MTDRVVATGFPSGLAGALVASLLAAAMLPVTPAGAQGAALSASYMVSNHGREAGEMLVRTVGDSVVVRHVFTDRNRGGRVETRYRRDAAGAWRSGESRPVLADGSAGPPTERFDLSGDSVRIVRDTSVRVVAHRPGMVLLVRGGTPFEQGETARLLLSLPGRTGVSLRGEPMRAEVVVDTLLRRQGRQQRARLVMTYAGTSPYPAGVWLDEHGALLATEVRWFITVRRDAVPLMPAMRTIELAWRETQAAEAAGAVRTATNETIAITGGDLFDSESGELRSAQTVIVRGDRIVAVGAAGAVTIPAGATVIDATGKTVMPGMWDMHTHSQVGSQSALGITQLANGLTTVRDLAADVDVVTSLRARSDAGVLAAPRLVLGGFIEGPLAWAGPTAAIVRDEAEAVEWVARYDSLGYRQIKLYNVVHPDLVPVIAREAKARGMLLSGHIPRGMSVEAAVSLGYDEIQHAAFLFSNFFPDSLYLPRMRAYSQVATAVAPTFDVDSPRMTALLEFLKANGTALDGTFNIWIGGRGALVGAGGSTDQEKADRAYLRLLTRLDEHGIPLILGTDNSSGSTFQRELEMHERAGIPAARVLQMATMGAARFMRDTADYGSVRVGKVADLLIVNGRPHERIGELEKIETVLRAGRRYDVAKLRRWLGASEDEGASTTAR